MGAVRLRRRGVGICGTGGFCGWLRGSPATCAAHLPAAGVPLWDYDARPGAPVDVSAGVITAAGLLHLAAACRQLEHSCPGRRRLGLAVAPDARRRRLRYASARPPLGLLRGQVLDERAGGWADGGELMFGVTYALEGLRLSRK